MCLREIKHINTTNNNCLNFFFHIFKSFGAFFCFGVSKKVFKKQKWPFNILSTYRWLMKVEYTVYIKSFSLTYKYFRILSLAQVTIQKTMSLLYTLALHIFSTLWICVIHYDNHLLQIYTNLLYILYRLFTKFGKTWIICTSYMHQSTLSNAQFSLTEHQLDDHFVLDYIFYFP